MKKLLLSFSIITLFSINAQAQVCTPAVVSNPGIFPDSATNFMPAYQGTPYSQIITAKVPADTAVSGFPIPIDKIKLVSITGLPQGLTYACVPSNCEFPGGQTNCAVISGTTNDLVGEYPLTIKVEPFLGTPPASVSYGEQTLTYYKIVVNPANATYSLSPSTFSVSQNFPNPSDNLCDVYYSLTHRADVEIKIINAIGKEIQRIKTSGNSGINKITLNTAGMAQGIYFYSVFNGQTTITKRLSVTH